MYVPKNSEHALLNLKIKAQRRGRGIMRLLTHFFMGLLLSVSMSVAVQSATESLPPELRLEGSNVVVRVDFDDGDTARRLAASFEPMATHYEEGYLLFYVNADEYLKLNDVINQRQAGLRMRLDLQETTRVEEHAARTKKLFNTKDTQRAIPGFTCYRTVEETFSAAQALVNARPNLAELKNIGSSWEKSAGFGGYDIKVLKLTNSAVAGNKPKLITTSAIHAREYTTAELATRFAEFLVNNYGIDADATWVLDHHEVHLILQANPDGRKQAEGGVLWRKNTNQNYCGATSNSRGADLNRNFPFQWGCCNGSSTNPCSETYRGSQAASEPETKAVRDYVLQEFPKQRPSGLDAPAPDNATGVYIDIHSSGKLVLWPWGFSNQLAGNATQLQTLGRKFAFFNNHYPQQAIGLYPADGATDDFAYGETGVAAFTFELGRQFFETCAEFENSVLPANMPALMYAAKVTRTPYMTASGPDALQINLSAGATASTAVKPGTQVNITATVDAKRYSTANGSEVTRNIAAAEFYIDTPPWQTGSTMVSMQASDGVFNGSEEAVKSTINTSNLSDGRHIVLVRGKGSNNNFGAISAAFLHIDSNGSGSSSGGSSSGGSSSGGSSSGGSSSGGSGGSCTSPQYSAGTSYSAGQIVQNGGNNYTCNVAGWCSSSAAWAYAPGTGTAWASAWTLVGPCGSSSSGGSSSGGSSSGGSSSGGSSSGGSSGGGTCAGLPVWSTSSVYTGGNQVQHNGVKYEAKWWTQGQDPATNSSQWAVWKNIGTCS